MIFYGSSGRAVNLGFVEERPCEICGKTQPFGITLGYKYIHLYWIFRWVTKKEYWLACPVCQQGWRLDDHNVEASLTSSIPLWDRYSLAGFAVVVAGLIGVAIALAPPIARRDDAGAIVDAGSVGAFSIKVGDCFNDDPPASTEGSSANEVTEVAGVKCSEPHDNEVYAIVKLDLPAFPGVDQMSEVATDSCLEHFEAFVGRDYESSMLDIATLRPTPRSWRERKDREVVCALYHVDLEKLTGSMKGSGM